MKLLRILAAHVLMMLSMGCLGMGKPYKHALQSPGSSPYTSRIGDMFVDPLSLNGNGCHTPHQLSGDWTQGSAQHSRNPSAVSFNEVKIADNKGCPKKATKVLGTLAKKPSDGGTQVPQKRFCLFACLPGGRKKKGVADLPDDIGTNQGNFTINVHPNLS